MALLTVLVLGMLLLLFHPVLITGRYYEITVQAVKFTPEGLVSMTFEEVVSYGTKVQWFHAGPGGPVRSTSGWNSRGRRFPRWPVRDQRDWVISLTTKEEDSQRRGDSPEVRQRWLLERGTYRIRPGGTLVLTRWQGSDGKAFESTIEAAVEP